MVKSQNSLILPIVYLARRIENIDSNKLLRNVGHEIKVKSQDKGIEITQCSIVGSRTYYLNLEGFNIIQTYK